MFYITYVIIMGKSYRLKNLYFSILPSNKNRCKLHIQWEIYIFREILYDDIVNKLKKKLSSTKIFAIFILTYIFWTHL